MQGLVAALVSLLQYDNRLSPRASRSTGISLKVVLVVVVVVVVLVVVTNYKNSKIVKVKLRKYGAFK